MRTVLVTGGAGFIGSCLVRMLLDPGQDKVINLDKLTYAGSLDSLRSALDDPNHVFVRGDVGDRALVADLLEQHAPHAVFHAAAESHVDRSIDGPAAFVETNVLGTFQLLEAVRGYWASLSEPARSSFRFIHVSTDEVYGSLAPGQYANENTAHAPNSPYAASKAAADHFARSYFQTYGLGVITTHCSNNFGPYQFPEKLLPLVVLNALEGEQLPLYGDGGNIRDWLFVEDHCRALVAALEHGAPGEVYNIGANCERTNLEIVCMVCRIIDKLCPRLAHRPCESLITFVGDRPGHDRRYALDSGKARRDLNWQPRHDLSSALRLTVEWYLNNSVWVDRVTSGINRRQRLGLATATTQQDDPSRARQPLQ